MIPVTNKNFAPIRPVEEKNKLSNLELQNKTQTISYASILKTGKAQSVNTKPRFTKIAPDHFPQWIKNHHTGHKNSQHAYKGVYNKIQNFSYMPRVLDWYNHPDNHLQSPGYKNLTADQKDWSLFIHSFPLVFDALIGSSFTSVCDTLWKQNQWYPDTKVLQFVSVVHVQRPRHVYESEIIPEKTTTGWHIFGIGAENFALYHKCFDESTNERPTGNAETYGWNELIPYLKRKTPSASNPINLKELDGYDLNSNELQIFYSETQRHLTFVFPDQTIYRFFQIYDKNSNGIRV